MFPMTKERCHTEEAKQMQSWMLNALIVHAILLIYCPIFCGITTTLHQVWLMIWAFGAWKKVSLWRIYLHLSFLVAAVIGSISISAGYIFLYIFYALLFLKIGEKLKAY